MLSNEKSKETTTCRKCGDVANLVSLKFHDAPVAKKLGGIGGLVVGTAIGETAEFLCPSCQNRMRRRAYIGSGKNWEYWE